MKTIIKNSLICISLTILIACTGYGEKLKFNDTEVYYTSNIDKSDAEKLGALLVKTKFTNGAKSVQLTKNTKTNRFIFRMVTTKEAATNKSYETIFKIFAKQISDSVFNKLPVDFHICDNTFTTLKELPFKDDILK